MNAKRQPIRVLILALSLFVLPLSAQQKDPQQKDAQPKDPRLSQPAQPQQPVATAESSSQSPSEPAPTASIKPDSRPVSGAEGFSLGIFNSGRDFVNARLNFSQSADSNSQVSAGTGTTWHSLSSIGASVSLEKALGHSQFSLDYSGGASFASSGVNQKNFFPSLGLRHSFNFRRFTVMVGNNFSYSPESSYGAGGLGYGAASTLGSFNNFGNSGGSFGFGNGFGGNLNPGIIPNQTIVNGRADRISDVVVGQMQYMLSGRNSLTTSASYGILHFLEGGFIDSSNFQANIGFDRQISATDSLAFSYQVGLVRFGANSRGVDTHSFHVNYGRRLTGRMALRVSAGPRVSMFQNAVTGSGSRVNWNMSSTLNYQFPLTNFAVRYFRGITGGSGLLLGANTDRVEFHVSRPISRVWHGGLRFGFARNASLQELNTQPVETTFRGIEAGVFVNRPIGRHGSLNFNYFMVRQTSNVSLCTPGTTACGTEIMRHTFTVGFSWGFGPYILD